MDRLLEKNRVRAVLEKMNYVRLQTDGKSVIAVHTESGTIAHLRLKEVQDKLGVNYDEFVGIIKGMLMRVSLPEGADLSLKECFGVILELADYLEFDGLCVAVQGLQLETEVDMIEKVTEMVEGMKEMIEETKEETIEEAEEKEPEEEPSEDSESDDEDWWL